MKTVASQSVEDCEGPHFRCGWSERQPLDVHTHTSWSLLKNGGGGDQGTAKNLVHRYLQAKNHHSIPDAMAVVGNYFSQSTLTNLIDCLDVPLRLKTPIIVVYPTPKFQDVDQSESGRHVTNALPGALASAIAELLEAQLDSEIIQVARPGRTKLNRIRRFLYQPKFEGSVNPKAVYILVDDAYTLGGTLAALRSHIVTEGGTVGAVCVLCNGTGVSVPFPISEAQVVDLKENYGSDFESYWKKEIGHDVQHLTHNEGIFLSEWARDRTREGYVAPILQRLRERIDSARATGK